MDVTTVHYANGLETEVLVVRQFGLGAEINSKLQKI